ncbi:MAG: SDR family NAD(P)-dependent oxidoreductase, partial [Thermoleophilia bacterium]
MDAFYSTGTALNAAAGRVAFTLGLRGPAMAVDTACSSSLVAMHLASQALRTGECSLALAGGATVMWTPGAFVLFSRQRGLAPDGRCKPFADAADGTAWSEGAGVLVLERLSDAEANGHRVLATIKGSAVNQDGASNGLTAPNGPSQERVIRQALANAGLKPAEVEMVEAHGTGTALGDPIEAGALLATYGQEREEPLRLGSLKSNIGHTQAAAGVAGVIKAVLAMREGVMPKTLHVERPSSKVEWGTGEIELLSEPVQWRSNGHPRRAGVSSFGATGTNAHMILEEAPVAGRDPGSGASAKDRDGEAPTPLAGPLPFLLSAKSPAALAAQAARLAAHLRDNPELELADVAHSLATTRAQLEERAVVVGEERAELLAALGALGREEAPPGAHLGRVQPGGALACLFSGQGSQRAGMGRELYAAHPAYAEAFDSACAEIDPRIERSLKELVFCEEGSKEAEALDHTAYAQPALFSTELALYRLLESLGLAPQLLCGHSVGEIVAAHVAGVLSLPDAARLVCARGELMGALPPGGAMAAIEAGEAEVLDSIAGREEELSLAAVNSPRSCVISGAEDAVEAIAAQWSEKGRKTKRLAVSHAFHSPLMEPMLERFGQITRELTYGAPQLPIVSCLSGEELSAEQAADPAHWVRHVREPVRFAAAIATLRSAGARTFIEAGPDPVLCAMAGECLEQEPGLALGSALREGRAERETLIGALATAHAAGAPLDWSAFFAGSEAKTVTLPTYPFQRKRYWLAPTAAGADPAALGQRALEHPFLAAAIEDPEGGAISFSGRVSLAEHPWLADHAVLGSVLFPGTGFLELALFAGRQSGAPIVGELIMQAPLVLDQEAATALRVTVSAAEQDGRREIAIHSRPAAEPEAGWTRHAAGTLSADAPAASEPLPEWPPPGAEPVAVEDLYARLAEAGFQYGDAFTGLDAAWRQGEDLYAEVALAQGQAEQAGRFALHPALLDAALHPIALESGEGVRLPFSWSGVSLLGEGAAELRVALSGGAEEARLSLFDALGAPLGSVESLSARPLDPAQLQGAERAPLFEISWEKLAPTPAAAPPGELWSAPEPQGGASGARRATLATLEKIQEWLSREPEGSRLAILTRGALDARPGEAPDPAAAALCGLVRSAASEHPGRFLLIDSDASEASEAAIEAALGADPRESQIALREGELLVPRLLAAKAGAAEGAKPIDPERTVLITGATGGLGALIARHLLEAHGARHLLLLSRSGPDAPGALDLLAQLQEQGAEAQIAACDVSDRAQLEELLAQIPAEHPLGAVIHCAAVLDDATVEATSAEQLERVFAPKAEGAWHLHELTAGLELSHFVCFSSVAGLLGSPGQGAYAAANCFLDGLAAQRRAQGLAATSLAWGLWVSEAGMTSQLGEADLARMRRAGIVSLSERQGLDFFDAALGGERVLAAAVRFDRAALAAQAGAGTLPPLLARLAGARARRGVQAVGKLAQRLREAPEAARGRIAEEFVRAEAAAILGHDSAEAVGPEDAFKDLGFDSLAAIELRNRLGAAIGLQLPATVVFDYPDAGALSRKIVAEASWSAEAWPATVRDRSFEEPIAIVGMACRLPGGVSSPAELWRLLQAGDDVIAGLPIDRGWDPAGIYVLDPTRPELDYEHAGGFLPDAADFDPGFFGVSPREAVSIDPQQRIALEASWEALEDAGIDPKGLRGLPVGVFTGVMHHDYDAAGRGSSGTTAGAASGRVSYALGLEGPAITVDTACSSSLVAMHLAAGALRSGECSLALAGGSTVLATPGVFSYFSRQQGLARDGRCKAFSDRADGVGISEGAGVLVLERLSDAEANGHRVLATIKGSAVN